MRARPTGPVLAVLALLVAAPASAQFPPDTLTNLQVLPKDIAPVDLIPIMASFTRALGVRCTYCHVGEEGQPLSTYDFAADDKPTKEKARVMLRMVREINKYHLAELPERVDPPVRVECATCHRGVEEPRMLQDVLLMAYDAGGVDSTLTTYANLRERYFGRFSYDFGETPLAEVAGQLESKGHLVDAVQLHALNVQHHPNSRFAQWQHARAAMMLAFLDDGPEAGVALYRDLRQRYVPAAFPERTLNRLGYDFLQAGRIQEAVAVFRLNVEAYPGSWNVHDSLGEGLAAAGETAAAIASYERSLELNPGNDNARQKLAELRGGGGTDRPR